MNIKEWLEKIGQGHAPTRMAEEAGLYRGTFSRQYNANKIPPGVVVAIARAYKADPLRGLVACGLLEPHEIEGLHPMSPEQFLATFSDLDLLNELVARVDRDGELAHPLTVAPLDETHPALTAVDDVEVPYEDDEAAAALDPGYDPEAEQDPYTT